MYGLYSVPVCVSGPGQWALGRWAGAAPFVAGSGVWMGSAARQRADSLCVIRVCYTRTSSYMAWNGYSNSSMAWYGSLWLRMARDGSRWLGCRLVMARSPQKRALSPCGGISPCGGTDRSAWHAKCRRARTQVARMMCAAVAWVFARMLGVRVWLVRGC